MAKDEDEPDRELGREVFSKIRSAVKRGDARVIATLLRDGDMYVITTLLDGIDVNDARSDGWTLMHVAAEVSGAVALVKLLAERGADVNAVTPDRWTPLHVAAAAGNAEAIRALLQNGADPTRRTLDGRTAEGIARGLRKRGIAEMLRDAASRSEGNPSRER